MTYWEVGNALVALIRRRAATEARAMQALRAYADIPIRLVDVDLEEAVALAGEYRLYAYDAYVIVCARNHAAPLLTLDRTLANAAKKAGLNVPEVTT